MHWWRLNGAQRSSTWLNGLRACTDRVVYRRLPRLVGQLGVGPRGPDHHLDELGAGVRAGNVQRGTALVVSQVKVDPLRVVHGGDPPLEVGLLLPPAHHPLHEGHVVKPRDAECRAPPPVVLRVELCEPGLRNKQVHHRPLRVVERTGANTRARPGSNGVGWGGGGASDGAGGGGV